MLVMMLVMMWVMMGKRWDLTMENELDSKMASLIDDGLCRSNPPAHSPHNNSSMQLILLAMMLDMVLDFLLCISVLMSEWLWAASKD
jgi:hypothetical protein